MSYTAVKLHDKSITTLLDLFPPRYKKVYADHITMEMGTNNVCQLMLKYPNPIIRTYGYITDGDSIEAVLVTVNNDRIRKDGRSYHITLSLDSTKGRKPVDSNSIIESYDFLPIDQFELTGTMCPILVV